MRLPNSILVALCLSLGAEAAGLKPGQKILLSKVDTLTLRNGQMTKGRRVEPIPQLKCVGGDGRGRYEVDVMRCKNQGSDYGDEDISWACSADVPKEFKLGATDVICEGYDGPDDIFVLKGSCGVEYRLALTDYGYEKYGYSTFKKNSSGERVNWSLVGFWLVFFAILGLIVYSACKNTPSRNSRVPRTPPRVRRPWYWGGGGGGGGGGSDPPPPYDSNSPPTSKPRYSTSGRQQGPGFWTGAAAGAAAGAAGSYLVGNRTRERERTAGDYGYTPSQSHHTPGQSWGGGESSTSGERHSSTGFGQTRRR